MVIERRRICHRGEQWDDIANKELGSTNLTSELLSVNPETCHIITFQGGEIINLPLIDTTAETDEAPWRR